MPPCSPSSANPSMTHACHPGERRAKNTWGHFQTSHRRRNCPQPRVPGVLFLGPGPSLTCASHAAHTLPRPTSFALVEPLPESSDSSTRRQTQNGGLQDRPADLAPAMGRFGAAASHDQGGASTAPPLHSSAPVSFPSSLVSYDRRPTRCQRRLWQKNTNSQRRESEHLKACCCPPVGPLPCPLGHCCPCCLRAASAMTQLCCCWRSSGKSVRRGLPWSGSPLAGASSLDGKLVWCA